MFIVVSLLIVICIIIGVFFWFCLGQGETYQPFEIRRSQNQNEIIYCAVKGEEAADPYDDALFDLAEPLPCYTFSLPEGWAMIQDGLETGVLNYYIDIFQTGEGGKLEFAQSPATAQVLASQGISDPYTNHGVMDPSTIQEVQFGDIQVIYSLEGELTRVYWVHEQSLLSFASHQKMDVNQMLALITRVDYNALRDQPQQTFKPLSLQRGSYQEVQQGTAVEVQSQPYCSIGNPVLPEESVLFVLPQPPQGYALVDRDEQTDNGYLLEKYQNREGELLAFSFVIGPDSFFGKIQNDHVYFPFKDLSNQELADSAAVQDAMVNGNPAFVHINQDVAEIGWIDGYCTLQLRSTAPMTAQELIALAETVQ